MARFSAGFALIAVIAGVSDHALAASAAADIDAPSPVRLDPRTPYFEYASSLAVGNKGEQALEVGLPADLCGAAWVFDHAQLTVLENRFGDAQLVEIPEPGCTQCRPLKLRWYHEPTGRIHFKVDVYRRPAQIPCNPELNAPAQGDRGKPHV